MLVSRQTMRTMWDKQKGLGYQGEGGILRQYINLLLWEKAMAPHSSTVARKIPWMEEPGRLQSMVSLRVGHD